MTITRELIQIVVDARKEMAHTSRLAVINLRRDEARHIESVVVKDHWYYGRDYAVFSGGTYAFSASDETIDLFEKALAPEPKDLKTPEVVAP